jgi:EmrB/QacA subfamily drug resistance transporter
MTAATAPQPTPASSTPVASTGTAAPPAAAPPGPPYRWRWLVLAVVLAAEVMDLLDSTVVNIAAPTIRHDLGGTYAAVQWIAAGYTLAFAVMLITGGRLGDIAGRKRMFLIGAAGFTISSVLCAFAQSPEMLIASRVLQGALGAVMIPQGFGVIKMIFPPKEAAAAFGAFGPVIGLSAVCGPIMAGALIDANWFGTGWRMIFLINLPVGLLAFLGAAWFMPESRSSRATRLDLPGMFLVVAGSLLLIYPLVQGRELGWPAWTYAMMLAALPVFAIFVWYERRREASPLIEAGLFAKRAFTGGLAVVLGFFCAMLGFMLVFGLFLQVGLGYRPLAAGLAMAPWALGTAIGAGVSGGVLGPRFGRPVIHAGLLVMIVGLVGAWYTLDRYGVTTTAWAMVPAVFVAGFGTGLVVAPLFSVVLAGVEEHEVGTASGVLNAVQQLGAAVGVAVVGTVFFSLLGTQAAPAAATQAPGVRTALADAGVTGGDQQGILDRHASCLRDRLTADDPDKVPASCTEVRTAVDAAVAMPEAGQRVGGALAAAGSRAVRADFTDVMLRTTWLLAGLIAVTFLLGYLLPRHARPEEI